MNQRQLKAIERVYAKVPRLDCKKKCAESCGPIFMEKLEWERIVKRLGYEPKADITKTLDCPLLKDGLCSVYTVRPMLCRLFGIVETMKCPEGCVPERWLTKQEGYDLIDQIRTIGEWR